MVGRVGLAALVVAATVAAAGAASGVTGAADQSVAAQLAAARSNVYRVANRCKHPIRVLVHLVDPVRGWRTHGWLKLQPGQKGPAYKTVNRYVYYYAESADGKTVYNTSRSGTRNIRVGAKIYKMGRINMGRRFRDYTQTICR